MSVFRGAWMKVLEDDVQTLRLPLSGVLCHRRSDGRWRFVQQTPYDDEQGDRGAGEAWAESDGAGGCCGAR
jgi:hypothetical protein